MSASREKKNRRNMTDPTPVEAPKKGLSKGLKRILTIAVSIILVAAIVFLGMVSTGFFQKHSTAVVADGHKLSPALMNYFYIADYQNVSASLSSLISSELPLSEQEYPGDTFATWKDYFIDYAASNAAEAYAIYDHAVAEGFTMSESGKLGIETQLSMNEMYASYYGTTADAWLASQYGTGCNAKNYEEYLTITTLVNEYATHIQNSLTYTDAQINEYYAENADQFDGVTFRYFPITPSTLDQTEGEEDLAACEEAANAIAEAGSGNEEAYLEAVAAHMPEEAAANVESSTLYEDYTIAACHEAFREWLSDDARQEGDTFVAAESENIYGVLYFVRSEDHTFQMPNVRHILISVEAGADEAAKAEAEKKAQDILDQYLAGEQTEEAFAELAKTNSSDNAEAGGLYEDIAPGTKVDTFDAWCYDEARQVGDTGIVETQYGYHVMYFSGFGRSYQNYVVEETMRANDYQEHFDGIIADVTYTVTGNASRYMIEI